MLNLTVVLCIIWALTLLYGEMISFWVPSLWACSWPHLRVSSSLSSAMNGAVNPVNPVKIAVLADPQLMDKTSHGLAPKSLALEISQFYADLFMRRSFLASIMPFRPDVILFLGDYFDGGHILSDEEWQESLSRFKHIFNLNTRSSNIQVYYLPGNHDIGYSSFHSQRPEVIKRYETEFGKRNNRFVLGKVEFIAIDAQTIDGHKEGNLPSASWGFVKNVSMDVKLYPRVLLTHIPLYRPEWTSCGSYRYSPVINQRVSRAVHDQDIAYQNYISQEVSDYLLDSIRPVLVLSAHDHDQCTVTHMPKYGPVPEHTLGTISWQQGNLYPSFMLLTANNLAFPNASSEGDAISTHLCFLPMQTHIYIWYLSLLVLTLLATLFWPTKSTGFWRRCGNFMGHARGLISNNLFNIGTKDKDEDENCEYEMIWDAEGSMHLVKKASKAPTVCSNESGLLERGGAVMRPAARKQNYPENDACETFDVNVDVGLDTTGRLLPRTSKSKAKTVILRLVRAFRILSVVAAVNVPLYMMLLFKDWIDQ
ncbi:uncharacterized protein C630.12 isoform X2 [Malania oleifera]|uniref:uncharacterized protein C630.12 isoform X2 n=1 Tax=Malania oleifera TaxID=397392 RepID=UPI0025AE94E1|nr:uncharacterized protein C630.12 isoform X2 [Malania oleifera]